MAAEHSAERGAAENHRLLPRGSVSGRFSLDAFTPISLALAVVLGLLAATQPPGVTFVALAIAAFALLGTITPLSALAVLLMLAPLRTLIATESPGALPIDIGQLTLAALVGFWIVGAITHTQR